MIKNNRKIQNQYKKNTILKNPSIIYEKKNDSIILITLAFCLPVLIYLQTINFGFTYFDDNLIILNNITFLSDFRNVHQAFLTDAFTVKSGSFSFYRPLQTLSYMIDIQLSRGNNAWMYHLSNILLLGLIACSLFLLLKRFLIPPKLALSGTLIYCAHPLFVSSVAWIPARGDLLLSFFSLLSFLFFIELHRRRKIIYLFLHIATFAIALFCKETAAVLPVLFILYYFSFTSGKYFEKKFFFNIILYAIIGIFWFWMRSRAIGGISTRINTVGLIPVLTNLQTIPESLAKFFLLIDITPIPGFSILKMLTGLGLIIIIIILLKNGERTKREKVFGIMWFFTLMLPPLLYKNIYIDYLDHRFFLPLIGILLFLLFILPGKWFEKDDIKRYWLIIVVFVFLSTLTFIKSRSYSDPMTYCNSSVRQNSNSPMAYNNRGNIRSSKSDFKGALEDYNKAIAICPNYIEAYNNRGNVKLNIGDSLGSLEDYNKAIAICPTYDQAYANRGIIKSNMGDNLGAVEDYSMAIAICPTYYQAYYYRGLIKSNMGNFPEAIEDYNKAIALCPNYYQAYYYRGLLKSNMGDKAGAIEDYDKAITIHPNYSEAYNSKGVALGSTGNSSEAIINFDKSIEINPKYWKAYGNRAITKYNLKDFTGAVDDCEKVLNINPNDKKALNLKANAKLEIQKIKN